MGGSGPGVGARVAVAASVGLMAASLVGVPAYVSSTGSAALAIQLDASCLSDLGVAIAFHDDLSLPRFDSYLEALDSVERPEINRRGYYSFIPIGGKNAVPVTTSLLSRPDQFAQLGVEPPGAGEVLVPEWATVDGALLPGTSIDLSPAGFSHDGTGDPGSVTLLIAGTYPDIPSRPEPAFWCSYRGEIRPNSLGDRPPPLLLASDATFDLLPVASWFRVWQLWPDADGLRRDQAATLASGLEAVIDREHTALGLETGGAEPVGLGAQVRRSGQVANFVALTIAPLRYAAVAAALTLLCAAGLLAARAQRRELRLRALRGVGAFGLARLQARWLVPVTLVGAAAGAVCGLAAVRLGGPSPGIEPTAIRAGLVAGGVGWMAALVVVAGVIGVAGSATVDPRRRRFANPGVVVVVAIVGLAVWSFFRLDEIGGVRQSGVQVRGGDLLAQAFPLLGSLAIVAVSAPLIAWLLRRGRRFGRTLPTPAFLGWRRVTAEPNVSAAVMLTAALAVAIAFQASLLTGSVDRLLSDKAGMFVGSDLALRVLESPPSIDGLGEAVTEVIRTKSDDRSIVVLGVDPSSFSSVAYWRDDASSLSLSELMSALGANDGSVPAILVDPDRALAVAPTTLSLNGDERNLEIVAEAAFFPGYKHGSPMLVINSSLIDRGEPEIWVRNPVDDAPGQLLAAGGRVTLTLATEDVFDQTSYLSARWAYDTLKVFAMVLAIVTVIAQLMVLEARQRGRRVAHVLARPMGLTRTGETAALAVEVGVPLLFGGVIGALTGWQVSALALSRLDSLRTLQPPAVLVVDVTTLTVAAGAIVVTTMTLAVIGASRSAATDAGEVMRVAES